MKINNIISVVNQIKIAYKHKRSSIFIRKTNISKSFLDSMLRQGFISNYKLYDNRTHFLVLLKSDSSFNLIFSKLRIVSSASRNAFVSYEDICERYSSSDFFVVLSSKGFLLSNEAFFFRTGGSLICDSSNYN